MKTKITHALALVGMMLGIIFLSACTSMTPNDTRGSSPTPGSYMSGGAGHSPH